ncbi:MAG: hypothetical protein SGBAC_009814 [Bacillariaceae sp.]
MDQEFSKRGELTWSEEEGALQITNDESSIITQESIQAMLDYGWYHVKIENNNAAEDDFVLSTVPACSIRRANFKDEFQVTLPRTQEAQITSLAYLPLASPLAPKSCEELDALTAPATFTSKVSLTLDKPGMILKAVLPTTKPPPGMKFIPHPDLKKNKAGASGAGAGSATGDAKGGGGGEIPGADDEPPQSFMRRYWYIILPLMIANFMGGPAVDAGAEGAAPAAAATVAATAASGGGGGGARRGTTKK